MFSEFADDIYEAAAVPEFWPSVLDSISQRTESALGSLFVAAPDQSMRWIGTEASNKLIADFAALDTPISNPRIDLGMPLALEGFFTDQEIAGDGLLFDHPFYRDFLYPRGYGWVAATTFALPTGETVFVSFERKKERGNMEPHFVAALDGLRPHFGRSATLSARLGLSRAKGMSQALNAVGIPAAVLKPRGALYVANPLFEKIMPEFVLERHGRVCLTDSAADVLLADAIARLGVKDASGQSRSIPVAGKEGHAPMIFHVIPVRGAANDIFSQSLALLVATPVDRKVVPTAEVLQSLFDLTPSEARVARGIAEGKTIEAIASAHSLSRETIRTQLAAVLGKTGLNRQAQLAALLSGSGLPMT